MIGDVSPEGQSGGRRKREMNGKSEKYLFEVSWEVCNQISGIYTVISTKVPEALSVFGERYYLLGPDLKNNLEFEETDEEQWKPIREHTAMRDIPCRFGRWKIPGEPKVILVNYSKKYNKDQLLYQLWEDHGVDSISDTPEYVERVMFGAACSEVIETIFNLGVKPEDAAAVAHFHEWMSGAGLLTLRNRVPAIGTVFTTHATVLGKSLASAGVELYAGMDHISPQREAASLNVMAKYSLEVATVREADVFTTVSEITTTEAKNFLGRTPDFILPGGLDIGTIPDLSLDRTPALKAREKILAQASRFLRKDLPTNTRIFIISGDYDFHGKGIDVFLHSLGRLDKETEQGGAVLALLCVLGGHTDLIPALQSEYARVETGTPPIATHRLHFEASDPILETCNRLGLKNLAQNRVNVIFVPAYLNGYDGLFNMSYYEVLSGCDLGVFPSYYEPWGYTTLESAAHAVPTVTTDQSGFGLWVQSEVGGSGVIVLKRRGRDTASVEEDLFNILKGSLGWNEEEMQSRRLAAREAASLADWSRFYSRHFEAYEMSAARSAGRADKMSSAEYRAEVRHVFPGTGSSQPHFRCFTAVVNLPLKIARLRELAYNLWWSWNPRALDLFAHLDTKLWEEMGNNPVRMLESVSPEKLAEAAGSESFLKLYEQVIEQFDHYMVERGNHKKSGQNDIRWSSPVAYFSTEYGLHECIPLYSGGLGTLSGDTLKTASDMNIPMVGVGLLYGSGFFRQSVDRDGIQTAEYPESDFSNLPVQIVQDDRGDEVQVSIDLPGRTLYARIWEIKVGRVSLFLLDSDVSKNTVQDRRITARLYPADQRTRIEQEILLGRGGVRLLEKLGVNPRVYHINEGHSAFLIFERITTLMTDEGLSFDEAAEVVRGSTVFTTHTPVEAGNERFARDLIEYYFSSFIKRTGISWSQFFELGRKEIGDDRPFFMNILGFKLSHMSNAVSRMHRTVSRRMWRDVWKGFYDTDIPIDYVTNGVHLPSYVAPRMRELLEDYLALEWEKEVMDAKRWSRVNNIPDFVLWRVRYELKQDLINFLRGSITRQWNKYGYTRGLQEEILGKINPSALMIGFARRFAPYKRADLLFTDLDRLDKIINHPERPVHVIYAGKAHPNDQMGRDILRKVIDVTKDKRFRGKIFFVEDYDLQSARIFVQGVDLWLNNPRRPFEACGTSGQKVTINGCLNVSTSDGWWCEGYNGTNGWTIGPVMTDTPQEEGSSDESDAQSLYGLIEDVIAPLYYERGTSGIPLRWISMIKRAMETLVPVFNSDRMMLDYYNKMYLPTARRAKAVTRDGYRLARELSDWKRKIPMRFSSVKLLDVRVDGIIGDSVIVGTPFAVSVHVDPGKLEPEEILAELVIGRRDGQVFIAPPVTLSLRMTEKAGDGTVTFAGEYVVQENGPHSYGVRVMPYNKDLASKQELGLVLWG
jgi:phosphorylase/glycogen(starch) synthase